MRTKTTLSCCEFGQLRDYHKFSQLKGGNHREIAQQTSQCFVGQSASKRLDELGVVENTNSPIEQKRGHALGVTSSGQRAGNHHAVQALDLTSDPARIAFYQCVHDCLQYDSMGFCMAA